MVAQVGVPARTVQVLAIRAIVRARGLSVSIRCVLAVTAALGLWFVTACSQTVAGEPARQVTGGCEGTGAPLLTLARSRPDQPHVAVPQPPGWEAGLGAVIYPHDSAMVMLSNPALEVGGHTPNVLLTVDAFTAPAGEPHPEQWALNAAIADIDEAGEIIKQAPATVCDHPGAKVHYSIRGKETTALVVVSAAGDRKVWTARLTLLTRDPNNPVWIGDTQAMLDGFVMNETPVH